MKTLRFAAVAMLSLIALSRVACAQAPTHDYYIFKITATIPVVITTINPSIDTIKTRTLKTNEIVNLALGQALTTKADPDIFLAMSLTFEPAGSPVLSKMIVCDKSQTGSALVKTTVATLDSMDYDVAYLGARRKGSGVGAGKFVENTTMGDHAKWALLASNFTGSGLSSGPLANQQLNPPKVSPVATATIQGRFKFRDTDKNGVTTDFNGIVTRAAFKLIGKILGTYNE